MTPAATPQLVRRPPESARRPLLSVIIPTYQRREQVSAGLRALEACRGATGCEVIVVVDGSTDGTAAHLASLEVSVALTVVEQQNQGAAAARNTGAGHARGGILLFLDDDMLADKGLLTAHLDRHRERPCVVLGHIPVHPDSPRSVLAPSLSAWVEARRERLQAGGVVGTGDWLTGQLSMPKDLFASVGGFDESFTSQSRFGGEDTDLLARLVRRGAPVVFAPEAVSWQMYTVTPEANLRQWRQSGGADASLVRKHPDLLLPTERLHRGDQPVGRLCRSLVASRRVRGAPMARMRSLVTRFTTAFPASKPAEKLHLRWRQVEYWAGAADAGGLSLEPRVAVLAYHAVRDSVSDRLAPYTVTPADLRTHIEALQDAGYSFLAAHDYAEHLVEGAGLPDRSVLLTFDDAYADLATTVLPILQELGIGAVAFVVPGEVGGVNAWDVEDDADRLSLLSWDGLHRLVAKGWELGGHSWSHAHLTRVSDAELERQLLAPADEMERRGLSRPRLLAFPYGEHDARVRAAARAGGYRILLGIGTRAVGGVEPRIEVRRSQTGADVVQSVTAASGLQVAAVDMDRGGLRAEAVGSVRWIRWRLRRARGRAAVQRPGTFVRTLAPRSSSK